MFPDVFKLPKKTWKDGLNQKGSNTTLIHTEAEAYSQLSDVDLGRLRYRGKKDSVPAADAKLFLGYNTYRYLLRKSNKEGYEYMLAQGTDAIVQQEDWQSRFGNLSDFAKKEGDINSKFVIDLATLGGYANPMTDTQKLEVGMDWYGTKKEKGNGVDSIGKTWIERFEQGMNKAFDKAIVRPVKQKMTPEQYAQNPMNWGTPGAALYDKKNILKINNGKKLVDAQNTKWLQALTVEPKEVLRSMKTKKAQYCRQNEKLETKKSRGVINCDIETFWKMDYISEAYLEEMMAGSSLSTLFMNGSQLREYWAKTAIFVDSEWRLPLDQSKFDQEQTKTMIKVFLKVMRERLIISGSMTQEAAEIFDNAEYAMLRGYVSVGSKRIPYKNGVLSGWRWTALIDTMLNAATLETAVEENGVADSLVDYTAQGDDLQTRWKNALAAAATWSKIQEYGFIVNPAKFFISQKRDEFLRKIITPNVIDGYPGRAINSIMWRNPANPKPEEGKNRISEMLDQWHIIVNRMNTKFKNIWQEMSKDIARANKMRARDIKDWLRTPTSVGGGGITEMGITERWMVVSEDAHLEATFTNNEQLPGLESIIKEAATVTDDRIKQDRVKKWAINAIRFPKIWEGGYKMEEIDKLTIKRATKSNARLRLPRATQIQAQYYSMDPVAAGRYAQTLQEPVYNKMSAGFAGEVFLSMNKLSAPRLAGLSNGWGSGYLNELKLDPAELDYVLTFRQPTKKNWRLQALKFEGWALGVWDRKRFDTPVIDMPGIGAIVPRD
jgi:hypothetical protein